MFIKQQLLWLIDAYWLHTPADNALHLDFIRQETNNKSELYMLKLQWLWAVNSQQRTTTTTTTGEITAIIG